MLAPGFSGQNLVKAGFMPIARHRVLPNSSEELAASTNVAARAFVQFARRMPLPVHYALENEPAGSKVGMLNLGGDSTQNQYDAAIPSRLESRSARPWWERDCRLPSIFQ